MGSCWSGTVVFNSLIRQTMGNAGRVSWHLTPLIARAWREAGRVPWHLTPLIARPWGKLVACPVAFNPLNRQAWREAGRVAWHLTPLIARPWDWSGKGWSDMVAGQVPWYLTPYSPDHGECWSRTVAFNPLNRQAMGRLVA
ncbi:hypothetical protein [Escherichia coli]|uniref:hypothetical protein n=1 Tax=Escherichia coli TaxID=562 RepID=UPI00200C9C49|nr:hypothetical protein [Escherichia coli]UPZ08824.1 hypothetical protein MYF75_01640 [Escherichia coli]